MNSQQSIRAFTFTTMPFLLSVSAQLNSARVFFPRAEKYLNFIRSPHITRQARSYFENYVHGQKMPRNKV